MAENGQFFDEPVQKEFAQVGHDPSTIISILSAEAHARQERFWKYSPKVHLVEHMTTEQAATFGNPRYYWCYANEDLISLMIEVAENCHVRTLPEMVLVKWLILDFDVDEDDT